MPPKWRIRLEFSFVRYNLANGAEAWRGLTEAVTVVTDNFSSAPQSPNCITGNVLLTDHRPEGVLPIMSPADAKLKATTRTIVASFIAGASAMVLVGLIAPIAVKGGLSVRDAMAATVTTAPLVQPLDVAAVRAQIAAAQTTVDAARAETEGQIERLDQLSGRR
jgi:hypothetical protein